MYTKKVDKYGIIKKSQKRQAGGIKNGRKQKSKVHTGIQANNSKLVSFRENIFADKQGIRRITKRIGKLDQAVF